MGWLKKYKSGGWLDQYGEGGPFDTTIQPPKPPEAAAAPADNTQVNVPLLPNLVIKDPAPIKLQPQSDMLMTEDQIAAKEKQDRHNAVWNQIASNPAPKNQPSIGQHTQVATGFAGVVPYHFLGDPYLQGMAARAFTVDPVLNAATGMLLSKLAPALKFAGKVGRLAANDMTGGLSEIPFRAGSTISRGLGRGLNMLSEYNPNARNIGKLRELVTANEEAKDWLKNWANHPETRARFNAQRSSVDALMQSPYARKQMITHGQSSKDYMKAFKDVYNQIVDDDMLNKSYVNRGLNPEANRRMTDITLVKQSGGNPKRFASDFQRDYIENHSIGGVSFGGDKQAYTLATTEPFPGNDSFIGKYGNKFHSKVVDPKTLKSISVHEGTHQFQNEVPFTPKEEKILKELALEKPKNIFGKVPEKHLSYGRYGHQYFTSPKEIHARMGEIRASLGKQPGEHISLSELNTAIQNSPTSGVRSMFKYVDKDKFLKAINTLRNISIPATGIGYALYQRNNNWLNKYQ